MPTPQSLTSPPDSLPQAAPGLPDFPVLSVPQVREAILRAMQWQRQVWEEIATDADPPTLASTVEALESARAPLMCAGAVLSTLAGSVADDEVRALEAEMSPLAATHRDALVLDRRIYERVLAVKEQTEDAESAYLVQRYLDDFERAGIALPDADAERLRACNAEISILQTRFSQAAAAGMSAAAVHIEDEAELAGLDAGTVATLRQAAQDRGLDGWLVTLILPTAQPLLTQAAHRGLRERIFRASSGRGLAAGDTDTRDLVLQLARVRAERAKLLGYPNHAEYVAAGATAGSSEAVSGLLTSLIEPAARNARAEAADLAPLLQADHPGAELEPWDWFFYAEIDRAARFAVDDAQVRPYLEVARVLADGVFYAAQVLYGLSFTEEPSLPGYADGVRVFSVTRADGSPGGLVVVDYYARPGKRGGAWMHALCESADMTGVLPVVVQNLNISRPPPGEPTLMTWDEVGTAFHEFGHALHGLLTDVRYPSVSGTAVPRDFVEYPSQVNEMWADHPQVLARYARHHLTGEPLPEALVRALQESASYGEGFRTTEYLGAALLDLAWHSLAPEEVPTDVEDVVRFEERALKDSGIAAGGVPPRYRTGYFNHAFGGGYDAAYYSYIWSEALDADTVEWFRTEAAVDGDGGFNAAAGARFAAELLSRGRSRDPLASYRALRGRDVDTGPLLRRRKLD